MIVGGLLELVSWLLHSLFEGLGINIPDLPQNAQTSLQAVSQHITDGLGIFAAFSHYDYVKAIFALAMSVEVAMLVYKFVVWLLKKIPVAGVS